MTTSKTPVQIQQELTALKTQYQTTAKELFSQAFADLFNRWPQLHSIGFKAYTPYFSDGDVCEYSVHNDDPDLNGFEEWGDDNDGTDAKPNLHKLAKAGDKDAKRCIEDVEETLQAFDNDVYEDVVGDHVSVTITRKGIKTEECEHD